MSQFVELLQFQSDHDAHTRLENAEFYANVEFPSWEQVIQAVNKMNGRNLIEAVRFHLSPQNPLRWFELIGYDPEVVAVCQFDGNVGNLFLENKNRLQSDEFFCFIGDRVLPERFVFSREQALQSVKYIYDFGKVDSDQSWVEEADIEDNSEILL